jgi:hypothetical protein
MTYDAFVALCEDISIPPGAKEVQQNPLLLALWHDHRGHWDTAHTIAQGIASTEGSVVHAYLHRVEGDLSNAQYWYSRAGRPMPELSLAEEWESLAREFSAES